MNVKWSNLHNCWQCFKEPPPYKNGIFEIHIYSIFETSPHTQKYILDIPLPTKSVVKVHILRSRSTLFRKYQIKIPNFLMFYNELSKNVPFRVKSSKNGPFLVKSSKSGSSCVFLGGGHAPPSPPRWYRYAIKGVGTPPIIGLGRVRRQTGGRRRYNIYLPFFLRIVPFKGRHHS